jgi:hypothetical protein
MSTLEVVKEIQSVENLQPAGQQKAAAKLSRIPVKVQASQFAPDPDSRQGGHLPTTRFYEIKQILRENAQHRVRGSQLPAEHQECRGHRNVHDHSDSAPAGRLFCDRRPWPGLTRWAWSSR